MPDPEVTGMTERALICMYPEDRGGCDETLYLVPVHYKIEDPEGKGTVSDTIVGWLCKAHALELALATSRAITKDGGPADPTTKEKDEQVLRDRLGG